MNILSRATLSQLPKQIRILGGKTKRPLSDFNHENLLSNENMMRAVSKFEALSILRMQPVPSARKAAVLIPLCEVDQKVSLLYTLRTSGMRSHRGQVSFPGGMQEIKDKSLRETALRETQEEIGIEGKSIKIWGQGHPIVARGETSVVPFIGTVSSEVDVKCLLPNPEEVEEIFTVSVEDLCKNGNARFTQFKSGYSMPCYFAGDKRIWGLTAIITHNFLTCFFPTKTYTHKIKYIAPIKKTAQK